ncbi:DedA family protein [Bacillus sp. HNG]|uniref:DedA family protein n=1 Tax=Bacillus sp. HNG TaxID=2293325 RepID=UPI000E2EFDBF|nr:DedA family protein [Bacillus sp. HNG]RFB15321.1 DedA family protein [Bacillus sp. HNG]
MGEQFYYLLEHYGYFGLIIVLAAGIIGLPLPDEILLTYVGYTVYQGKMSYSLSLVSASIGSIIGITISYFLGIKLGIPFLRKFGPKLHLTEKRIQTTSKLFNKFGPYLLFIGYFIPGVRHITAYLAGLNYLNFKRFAIFAYSGAIFWGFTFITLGHELGKNWMKVEMMMNHYIIYVIGFAIIIVLGAVYLNRRKLVR